jgi:lipopolysaccharide biosynthesis glycosyltransferase
MMIQAKATANTSHSVFPERENVVIVCGADDKFAMPLAVTMFSALINLGPSVIPDLFIIDGGIKPQNKRRVEQVLANSKKRFNLQWIPFDLSSIGSVRETSHISKATYLRILIPDLLPQSISKAIYLDCDMIIEKDLNSLWEIEFEGELAMGVQDFCYPYVSTPNAVTDRIKIPCPADTVYCNCGMLVLNLAAWRKYDIKSKIFAYLAEHHQYLINNDQEGINVIVAGNWKLLDPKWNVTLSSIACISEDGNTDVNKIESLRDDPYIIHFTSPHKPWHTGHKNANALNSFYYDQSFRSRYFHYVNQSGWFNKLYSHYWINHRRMVLFLEYKLPRRMKLLFS